MKFSQKRKRAGLKRHFWTLRENNIYLKFLQEHLNQFTSFQTRKQARVFIHLARSVKSRKTDQVKSHHQKLMNKYGSIQIIIATLLEEQEVFAEDVSDNFEMNPQATEEIKRHQNLNQTEHQVLAETQEKTYQIQGLNSKADLEQNRSQETQEDDLFGVLCNFELNFREESGNSFFQD